MAGILEDARLDRLADETYFFPANEHEDAETVFLPLRKWDIIFTGLARLDSTATTDPIVVSRFIPGVFDHILIYAGKDRNGYAYAVELNTEEISLDGFTAVVTGGHRFVCLGRDFGEDPHPSGAHLVDRGFYGIRWAKTFRPEDRALLMAADGILVDIVRRDILTGYPYEFELRHSGRSLLIDPRLVLIDDGRENGAGCADYWTSLFEEEAGVCMKGVRWTAREITDYYLHDPVGRTAFFPAYLNPLGTGDVTVATVLALGVEIVDDPPHRFVCDGTEETGLVLPSAIFASEAVMDIPPVARDGSPQP